MVYQIKAEIAPLSAIHPRLVILPEPFSLFSLNFSFDYLRLPHKFLLDASLCSFFLLLTNLPSSTMTTQTSPSLYEIDSVEHFQSLLSADLQRISLINFWAPWAEPCKQMNEVVRELSKKYPELLVLQVCPSSFLSRFFLPSDYRYLHQNMDIVVVNLGRGRDPVRYLRVL